MVSTHETIPRPPVRFLSLYAHLPADGRWEGRGTPPARLKATPISLADASRVPGPGGLPSRSGTRPVLLILPSAPRQFGQSGDIRPGGSRSKTSPAGVGEGGAEARGDPTTPESLRINCWFVRTGFWRRTGDFLLNLEDRPVANRDTLGVSLRGLRFRRSSGRQAPDRHVRPPRPLFFFFLLHSVSWSGDCPEEYKASGSSGDGSPGPTRSGARDSTPSCAT